MLKEYTRISNYEMFEKINEKQVSLFILDYLNENEQLYDYDVWENGLWEKCRSRSGKRPMDQLVVDTG